MRLALLPRFIPVSAVIFAAVSFAAVPSLAQAGNAARPAGDYQSYGAGSGTNKGAQISAPMLGSWMGQQPMQGNNGQIFSFGEYFPNGNFRSTSVVQGGTLNGMRMQMWGRYSVKQLGAHRYALTTNTRGIAPQSFCVQGGGCNPNARPGPLTETIDMLDANSFHSSSTINGVSTEVDLHRAPIPQELTTQVPAQVMLPAAPQAAGRNGGGAPTMPALHPYVTPGGGNKTMGNNCDNMQQARICTVNNGHMYTDSRGCRVCASGN